jgi:hypothetical protein
MTVGSIATELRCPRDVRSSLNFRHSVATSRTSKRAKCEGQRVKFEGRPSAKRTGKFEAHQVVML